MRKITSIDALETLGRVRLSRHFFMRDFLYSEIGNFQGIPNIPDDPDLAIKAGERLCQELLDPLFETFGNVIVRSAYRSPAVNQFGNEHGLGCASNERNYAGHIWDGRDAEGHMGACASIVVPWFATQYEAGRDWRDMAWWIHDHLPYSSVYFFPVRAAFNLTWREEPLRTISSYVVPKGLLLRAGAEPSEPKSAREERYADFPQFRGVALPPIPDKWAAGS
ncbi:MAG: hypothetical protein K0B16_18545 [Burkholderiaceae bacterium]|nr:hypothetical protein [Burkholderiaceae bacterium]